MVPTLSPTLPPTPAGPPPRRPKPPGVPGDLPATFPDAAPGESAGDSVLGVPGVQATSISTRVDGRETFNAFELAVVLSHYDLGAIRRVREFPRGSRKAPKLHLKADAGEFLLKRRAKGRDDPYKVAFTHELQLFLADRGFPLPHLIGTRRENNSMLQLDARPTVTGETGESAVYELFEYIPGKSYDASLEATTEAGRVLAIYHKVLDGFEPRYGAPTGSYHRAPAVEKGLKLIAQHVCGVTGTLGLSAAEGVPLCRHLLDAYRQAADAADAAGLADWPSQVVHGDWHPGNMLFADARVVAVIDYDSARALPRVIDIANGALQFSILGGDDDLSLWPDYLDETRFRRFLRGYDDAVLLSKGELRAVPHLMIEALIAEAVFPIAATGQFGRLDGGAFLRMIRRKIAWLRHHSRRLTESVEA